ncbi:hypothetical protein HHK36_013614 [Tetracentron sinense]|uniref:Flowering-promoting factor 1-like protein 1 n=1 Tax=Tetracentron sinense TaxID=13715 RepID=A0A834Z6L3_TETSI|nr:hypothetical protein HHK36_013614 [Tetracentron sinense]
MSGVWVFKNGVIRLVENPATDPTDGRQASNVRRKVLVYLPTGEVISSYTYLEQILTGLGWERYYYDVDLLQFHKKSSVDLISLPKDFSKFKSIQMYDIVVKNPNIFHVRDINSISRSGPQTAALLMNKAFLRMLYIVAKPRDIKLAIERMGKGGEGRNPETIRTKSLIEDDLLGSIEAAKGWMVFT